MYRKCDHTVSRFCHDSSPIFEQFLSQSSESLIYHGFEALKCFITCVYFVLITDCHAHTVWVVLSNESCNAKHHNIMRDCIINVSQTLYPHELHVCNKPCLLICITICYIFQLSHGITYQSNILLLYRHISGAVDCSNKTIESYNAS